MDSTIVLFLVQDAVINGAIYALVAVALLLVFAVTRVILVPQGEFVAFSALTLAALHAGKAPQTGSLLVALGVRYFSQSRYVYKDTIRRPDTFFSSVGPTSLIRWDLSAASRLLFQGWYERRKQSDGTFRSLASMTMHVFLHF